MRPQPMLVTHDPEHQHFGDCARACIASVLDMDTHQVPHFYHDGIGENGHQRMQGFLRNHGLCLVQVPMIAIQNDHTLDLQEVLTVADYWTDGLSHYMLGGTSETGCGHFVIAKGDKVVHNPGDADLIGPQDDGFWWIGIFGKVL